MKAWRSGVPENGPSRSVDPLPLSPAALARREEETLVMPPKRRRVTAEMEGKYVINMPKGTTPRTRRILARQQAAKGMAHGGAPSALSRSIWDQYAACRAQRWLVGEGNAAPLPSHPAVGEGLGRVSGSQHGSGDPAQLGAAALAPCGHHHNEPPVSG